MLSQSLITKNRYVRLLIISVIGISIMGLLNYWSMHVYTCTYITCKTSILIMLILLGFFWSKKLQNFKMTFNENECMNFRLFFKCLIKIFFSVHASLHVLLYAQIKKFFIEEGGQGRGGYEWSFFQPDVGVGLGLGGRRVSGLV